MYPKANVSIVNDSCGEITLYNNTKSAITFTFDKQKHKQNYKHRFGRFSFYYLIINNVNDTNNIISLEKGDTMLYLKNTNNVFSGMKIPISTNKKYILNIRGYICVSYHNTISELTGKIFTYKNKNRKLELEFINDSICNLANIFDCPDIEQEYKIIVQECAYSKKGDDIYLKSKESKFGNSAFIEIPAQNSDICGFLNERNKKRPSTYSTTEYEQHGLIPNITTDTLHIIDDKIVLYRVYNNRSNINFVFK